VRRAIPLLLVLAVLLPQAALAGEWYRCRADSRLRESCCCPAAAQQGQLGGATAELHRTPCCTLLRVEPRALQARTEPTSGSRASAPAPVALPASPSAIPARDSRVLAMAARATAPPRGLEPLYLRHASLLL
jgi:hypothetical protein